MAQQELANRMGVRREMIGHFENNRYYPSLIPFIRHGNICLKSFSPENGYKHSGLPDFEVYTGNDIHDPNYEMEL